MSVRHVSDWGALGRQIDRYSRGELLGDISKAFALVDDGHADAVSLRVGRHNCLVYLSQRPRRSNELLRAHRIAASILFIRVDADHHQGLFIFMLFLSSLFFFFGLTALSCIHRAPPLTVRLCLPWSSTDQVEGGSFRRADFSGRLG